MTSVISPASAAPCPDDEYQRFLNCGARKAVQVEFQEAIKQGAAKAQILSPHEQEAFIQRIGEAQIACDADAQHSPFGRCGH
jgi:hypothetical protein